MIWLQYEDAIIAHLFERIEQWRIAGYPHPQTYFTAGLERQVANMIDRDRRDAIESAARVLEDDETIRMARQFWPPEAAYEALPMLAERIRALLAPPEGGNGE